MKIANTNIEMGQKVRIKLPKSDEDYDWLNGRVGIATNKFPTFPHGTLGVYLDNTADMLNGFCNVTESEVEVINE